MNRNTAHPPLPDRISRLAELAVDLWWSWNPDGRQVFRSLDYTLWRARHAHPPPRLRRRRAPAHTPARMLWPIARARLDHAAGDPEFLRRFDRAIAALDAARAARN